MSQRRDDRAIVGFALSHSIRPNALRRKQLVSQKLNSNPLKCARQPRQSRHSPSMRGERQRVNNVNRSPVPDELVQKIFAGFDPSPELAAILLVYFVQGALGISRLAVSFFLKDALHLSPAETAALTGFTAIPWLIKPLYGFLSDSLPLFGYRRRSYLVGAGAIGVAAWSWLATGVESASTALLACILTSLSVAVSDVVVDSIVVQRVRGLPAERSGALQSLCWGVSALGSLFSAYFSGSLLETLRPQDIFALTAVLPLGTSLLAGMIQEKRVKSPQVSQLLPEARSRINTLKSALSNPSVYLPIAFIFTWQSMPSPESALFFFSTNALGFGPEFLGRVRLVSSAAALLGLWVYRKYLQEVELKLFFFWATIISVPLSLTQVILVTRWNIPLGISDQLFALTDSAVLTALGQVVFMPTLVLAARLCPPGVEGTLFAALMSIYNTSGTVSSELGALLTKLFGVSETNFENLWLLVTVCSFSNLLALPFVDLVDRAQGGKMDRDADFSDGEPIIAPPKTSSSDSQDNQPVGTEKNRDVR